MCCKIMSEREKHWYRELCSFLIVPYSYIDRVVSRTYRLVSLQKTTPEELYARRVRWVLGWKTWFEEQLLSPKAIEMSERDHLNKSYWWCCILQSSWVCLRNAYPLVTNCYVQNNPWWPYCLTTETWSSHPHTTENLCSKANVTHSVISRQSTINRHWCWKGSSLLLYIVRLKMKSMEKP